MSKISDAVAVKQGLESFLKGFDGVVRVQTSLGPNGPEVQVVAKQSHMKRLRLQLPTDRHGIHVVVVSEK